MHSWDEIDLAIEPRPSRTLKPLSDAHAISLVCAFADLIPSWHPRICSIGRDPLRRELVRGRVDPSQQFSPHHCLKWTRLVRVM